jgi:cysteine desulfurase/selenocysteine lyase
MQASPNIDKRTRYDVDQRRADFPILQRTVNNRKLIYFDNGATSQKPQAVIDALVHYYNHTNANIHRGVHQLSQEASADYEQARATVQQYLHAASVNEIVFTRGTTEAINLIAQAYLRPRLQSGDEVVITEMEHHSNILPWQQICDERKASLRVIPVTDDGELDLKNIDQLLTSKTKLLAVTHVSNTLGTINPIRELVDRAHAHGIPVLVDGAQAVPHMQVDVRELGCDFYCFSGHKVYGPTGIGVLYIQEEILTNLPPWQGGGGIISEVTFEKTTYVEGPLRFEAGTPNIEGVIGLAAALDYVNAIGIDRIATHENELLNFGMQQLLTIPRLHIIGNAKEKAGVLSFVIDNLHPYDIGTILDQQGIAVRTGHHCTQPLMKRYGIPGTVRISFGLYNTKAEIDVTVAAIHKAIQMLS